MMKQCQLLLSKMLGFTKMQGQDDSRQNTINCAFKEFFLKSQICEYTNGNSEGHIEIRKTEEIIACSDTEMHAKDIIIMMINKCM